MAHDRRALAVSADAVAMLASTLYIVATAGVAITSGVSVETVAAFLAIAIGGSAGTFTGMALAAHLERRFGRPVPHRMKELTGR